MDKEKACEFCGETFRKDPRNTYKYWAKARFCSSKCAGSSWSEKHKSTHLEAWEKVKKSLVRRFDTNCMEWHGPNNGRYGVSCKNGKNHYVHRISLEAKLGRNIQSGMIACHTCDNTICANPDHLYEGTHAKNSRDAVVRGGIWWRKLTEQDVMEIRRSSKKAKDLALKYNVSSTAIYKILRRKTWKHIN